MTAQKEKKSTTTNKKPKRLVLLDAHAILHRAYHALPEFASQKGEPTGALYGLSSMLIKLIGDLSPDYLAACYDMPGPTFRHEAYEAYKAKRPKAEDDLIHQMNRSRDIFHAFGIPVYEKTGFEADDIIGTIVSELHNELRKGDIEIVIASGDMDTMQLVSGKRVQVYTLKKGIKDTVMYDEDAVIERFGFAPELLPDYKGLRGDPSDNIPGVLGIGEKTATILIQACGTIESLYSTLKKNPQKLEKKGIKERVISILKENEEEALFSKTLASIRGDVPISFALPGKTWSEGFAMQKVETLFHELGFRTLLERVKKLFPEDDIQPREKESEEKTAMPPEKNTHEARVRLEELKIAAWLLNSSLTNPTEEDILAFARAKTMSEAKEKLFSRIKDEGFLKLFNEIEAPLIPIIHGMEARGIKLDTSHLHALSKRYHKELEAYMKKIWKEAGVQFNLNSPKQLSEVLFDRLLLSTKGLKKTEGGARSTRESELEKLRDAHPIIGHILSYRELQKLLSTYIDNIPHMVRDDGRLHAQFIQTGTTTGRMSSMNPNLQNIPIKGERGTEIRQAFVSEKGHVLAAFDYSQIELRMFAILSSDGDFLRIFKEGQDVHNAVASEVFGVSSRDVTSEMRRRAKVINFGILYGMGVTSLQKSLGGSREEAARFYQNYFSEFPGVARYIDSIKKFAAEKGYTETLFGRRRYFEGLASHIPYIRAGAERMAVNAPVQGSAADVIKLAMKRAEDALRAHSLAHRAHLLLQVHDELVYEIEENSTEKAVPVIKKSMEHVLEGHTELEGYTLVPLDVRASVGPNWGEMA